MEREVDGNLQENDSFEKTLRPASLDEYIGQKELKSNLKIFIEETNKLGIQLTDNQLQKLEKFYELLISWNEKMTARRPPYTILNHSCLHTQNKDSISTILRF